MIEQGVPSKFWGKYRFLNNMPVSASCCWGKCIGVNVQVSTHTPTQRSRGWLEIELKIKKTKKIVSVVDNVEKLGSSRQKK